MNVYRAKIGGRPVLTSGIIILNKVGVSEGTSQYFTYIKNENEFEAGSILLSNIMEDKVAGTFKPVEIRVPPDILSVFKTEVSI